MNTQLMRLASWAAVLVLGTLIPAISNAGPPITTGLYVNLSAEDPANFTFGDPNQIALWKDAANDGNDASFQDFGNSNAANQPLFTQTLMPNGLYMNVVDFSRGG